MPCLTLFRLSAFLPPVSRSHFNPLHFLCTTNTERFHQTTSVSNEQTACTAEFDFLKPCQCYPELPTKLFVLDRQKQGTDRHKCRQRLQNSLMNSFRCSGYCCQCALCWWRSWYRVWYGLQRGDRELCYRQRQCCGNMWCVYSAALNIHFNIILPPTPSSSFQVSTQQFCTHFSFLPCALHAQSCSSPRIHQSNSIL